MSTEPAPRTPEFVTYLGERHWVCSPECAHLYQERCPDRAHVPADDDEVPPIGEAVLTGRACR